MYIGTWIPLRGMGDSCFGDSRARYMPTLYINNVLELQRLDKRRLVMAREVGWANVLYFP